MNTDMTAETEVRCTDSATVRTDRSSWSWHSSSVSASMTIAGYLLGWWFEALQTSDACRTPQFSVTCQFVKNSLWDITFPEQTSATLVGRRVSGQVAASRIVDYAGKPDDMAQPAELSLERQHTAHRKSTASAYARSLRQLVFLFVVITLFDGWPWSYSNESTFAVSFPWINANDSRSHNNYNVTHKKVTTRYRNSPVSQKATATARSGLCGQ